MNREARRSAERGWRFVRTGVRVQTWYGSMSFARVCLTESVEASSSAYAYVVGTRRLRFLGPTVASTQKTRELLSGLSALWIVLEIYLSTNLHESRYPQKTTYRAAFRVKRDQCRGY